MLSRLFAPNMLYAGGKSFRSDAKFADIVGIA